MVIMGLIALMWLSILLAVSYFVFLTAEKAPESIKSYGRFVGGVLVAAALVVVISGITMLVTNTAPGRGPCGCRCPMMGQMQRGDMGDMGMCDRMRGMGKGQGGMLEPSQERIRPKQ